MTAVYGIYPALNLKYARITDKTHLRELRDLSNELFDDPQFSCDLRQPIDLTGMTHALAKFRDAFFL